MKKLEELELMRASEVAAVLNLHERTVLRMLKAGDLPSYKVGASRMVDRADLEAYLHGGYKAGPAGVPVDRWGRVIK